MQTLNGIFQGLPFSERFERAVVVGEAKRGVEFPDQGFVDLFIAVDRDEDFDFFPEGIDFAAVSGEVFLTLMRSKDEWRTRSTVRSR